MELAALLLLVPIGWVALSWRSARRARQSRVPGVAIVAGAVVAVWIAMQVMASPSSLDADYADGDKALRLLLE